MSFSADTFEGRTDSERLFLAAVLKRIPNLDVWPHQTKDGAPG